MGVTDILCLQEVKTIGFLLHISLLVIWSRAKYFCSNNYEGKDGIVILVSPKFASTTVHWVSNALPGLVWILLNLDN